MPSVTTLESEARVSVPPSGDDDIVSFQIAKEEEDGLRQRGRRAIARATRKGKDGLKKMFRHHRARKEIEVEQETLPTLPTTEYEERRLGERPGANYSEPDVLQNLRTASVAETLSAAEREERRLGKRPSIPFSEPIVHPRAAVDWSLLRAQLPLQAPDLDYSEFAQYDKLQKEFKDEARGNGKELEWKTAFLDLATEQELLEDYLNGIPEILLPRQDVWRDRPQLAAGHLPFLRALKKDLLEDREDVLLDQAVNRDAHGKTEEDGREIWKRIIKLRREGRHTEIYAKALAPATIGRGSTVLDKYEGEVSWPSSRSLVSGTAWFKLAA